MVEGGISMTKRGIVILMLTIILLGLLSGCKVMENYKKAIPNTQISSTTTKNPENNSDFDVYQITGDNSFSSYIYNNCIDNNYKEECIQATTTSEFLTIERKYLNIWKEEMVYALANISTVLSDQDKDALNVAQKNWETGTLGNLQFERSLIENKENYHINLGSGYLYLKESEIREAYRQRTIRLKYIHYILETQTDNPVEISECLSLKFKANNQ